MKEVLELTWNYRVQWKVIGEDLNVDPGILDSIHVDRIRDKDRLSDLISHLLRDHLVTRKQMAMALLPLELDMDGMNTIFASSNFTTCHLFVQLV